jgi:hypothetical protein
MRTRLRERGNGSRLGPIHACLGGLVLLAASRCGPASGDPTAEDEALAKAKRGKNAHMAAPAAAPAPSPGAPLQIVDLGSLPKSTYVTGEQGAPVDVTLRNVSTAPFGEDIYVDFTIQNASTGATTNLFHNTHTLAESGAQIAPGATYVAGILPYFLTAVGAYEARLCVSWGPDPASPEGQDCRDMGPVAIIDLAQPTAAVSLESSQANAGGTQSIAVGVTNTSNAKLNYELSWVLTNRATGERSGPFPFSAGTSAALTLGVGEHQSASFTLSPAFGAGDYTAHLSCWASPGNLTVGCSTFADLTLTLGVRPTAPIQIVDLGSLPKTTYVTGEQGSAVNLTLRNASTAPFGEDIYVDFTIQNASTGATTNLFHNTHTLAESGTQIAPGATYVAGILPYFLAAIGSYEARLCVSWGPDPASPEGQECRDMGPVAIVDLAQPTAAVSVESNQANADGTQSIAVGVTNTSNAKLDYILAWVLTNQATGERVGPFPFQPGTSATLMVGVGEHQSASFTLAPVLGAGTYTAHLMCWASPGNLTVGCATFADLTIDLR